MAVRVITGDTLLCCYLLSLWQATSSVQNLHEGIMSSVSAGRPAGICAYTARNTEKSVGRLPLAAGPARPGRGCIVRPTQPCTNINLFSELTIKIVVVDTQLPATLPRRTVQRRTCSSALRRANQWQWRALAGPHLAGPATGWSTGRRPAGLASD